MPVKLALVSVQTSEQKNQMFFTFKEVIETEKPCLHIWRFLIFTSSLVGKYKIR